MKPHEEHLSANESDSYRESLMSLWEKATSAYGSSVLLLSGGALGISLTILKDFISTNEKISWGWTAWAAWIFWVLSLSSILFSYPASANALLKAVMLYDKDKEEYVKKYQSLSRCVKILNILGGLFFIAGLVSWIIFMWVNLQIPLGHATSITHTATVTSVPAITTPAVTPKPNGSQ